MGLFLANASGQGGKNRLSENLKNRFNTSTILETRFSYQTSISN